MFEYILLDLDDTILDFKWAENQAITGTLKAFDIEPTEEICWRYSQINLEYWHALERKEVTREQLKVGRFRQLLQELGREADPAAMGEQYLHRLGQGHRFLPGALETLQILAKKYRLFLVSNGNPPVQYGRLASAGITHYFEKLFISMEIGHNKPSVEFFDRCFSQISGFDRAKAIIVGDSLFSDIRGGINAGIATCWVNPGHRAIRENIVPDYQIENLPQLLPLLEAQEKTTQQ